MRRWIPELAAVPLLPFLMLQGRTARRRIPRLPEADGPTEGIHGTQHGGQPLRLVGIGESTIAGVGVQWQDEAITAQLAAQLSMRFRRSVAWQSLGRNGATLDHGILHLLPALPACHADIVLIGFGVNDTTSFLSPNRWRDKLTQLLDMVNRRLQPSGILLSGVPPVGRFPALPMPLRTVLGLKAATLDNEARLVARRYANVSHVPLPPSILQPHLMASDGFHPSAAGCATWAMRLAASCPTP
ncbi:Lysophospholipase L1 [Noviherbaspirillum humi]|uniref:Lysophospholipase L1 n=1 Tax=Noviherbaspirillum humi TaxID=1688639 RepID=A0A239BX74_9BURK|nr:SGNH/GDSL hydrolase family protein [Noviherbaspirillum humi]SNS12655.1 Lysophospholipase L1 [Noviherbaspirillum humi]